MHHSSTGRRLGRWRPFHCLWPAHWPSFSLAPRIILQSEPKTSMDALALSVNLSAQMSSVPTLAEQLWMDLFFLHLKVREFLFVFCVRNSKIVRWTLTVSVNISLQQLDFWLTWKTEVANGWFSLFIVCNVFFCDLSCCKKLPCSSTKSDIYVVDSCYSDPDVFCFTWEYMTKLKV